MPIYVVLGATGGVGWALCERLAGAGAQLVLGGRNESQVEQLARTTGKASTAIHALGRISEPADVAAALAWLLDPAQGWVTGQVLGVDGGLGSVRARGPT